MPPRKAGPGPVAPRSEVGVEAASPLVALAEVARPHGIKGELRLKVYNSDSDLLLQASEVVVEYPDGERRVVEVGAMRRANDAMVARLAGCDDRDDAEALRGAKILLPRSVFPALDEGEFYVCDLIGARVVGPSGEVGKVIELLPYPSVDVLVIESASGKLEVPLVDDLVEAVDTSSGLVTLRTTEGLEGV